MMEQSAKDWATDLARVGEDLSHVAHRIQVVFGNAAERAKARGEQPIPDPVKLLRRLAALEKRSALLRTECLDVAERRDELVARVTEAQLRNVERIQELSKMMEHLPVDQEELAVLTQKDEEQDLEGLAASIATQHELFAPRDYEEA